MKLRNKKTGEIWDIGKIITNDHPSYDTLKSINEDFEDYKEPLIKDLKIRRAVRAWAEANEFDHDYTVNYYQRTYALVSWQANIEFNCGIGDLEENKEYTITELCGEVEDADELDSEEQRVDEY